MGADVVGVVVVGAEGEVEVESVEKGGCLWWGS